MWLWDGGGVSRVIPFAFALTGATRGSTRGAHTAAFSGQSFNYADGWWARVVSSAYYYVK